VQLAGIIQFQKLKQYFRVATNLEYSGISLNMENSEFSGNSVNSVEPQGKNCNKQSIFSSSFKYL